MRKLLAVIMLFAGLWVWAGAVPEKGRKDTKFRPIDVNMDSIRVNIQNPRSNYYYKRLWRKYQSNDTNMSLKEYRHLYLGYVFSEDYDPYRQSEFSKKIQPLYYKKHHTPAECDTIIKYAELSLADDPFDLKQMEYYIYVLKERQKYTRAAIMQSRLNNLIKAIMSTGTGTKEKPWVVISPVHEYVITNGLNFKAAEHLEYEGDIDYIKFENPKSGGPEGFWFDVSSILRVRQQKFGDE